MSLASSHGPQAEASSAGTAETKSSDQASTGAGTGSADVAASAFCEDTGSLLAKYAKSPPSIELHIYPTHYRFSGQEGIIPKNNAVMAMFLNSVREGVIPAVASEVFRDSGIPLYEGCAILKLVDFRNFNPRGHQQKPSQEFVPDQDKAKQPQSAPKQPQPDNAAEPQAERAAGPAGSLPGRSGLRNELGNADDTQRAKQAESKDGKAEGSQTADGKAGDAAGPAEDNSKDTGEMPKSEPPSFRVLLRPTGSSMLNDLMGLSDAGTSRRLTDFFAISMEAEILSLTVRQLDLRVPERRSYDLGLKAVLGLRARNCRKHCFKHRITHPRRPRRIVDENPHTGTAYEDFMLGMADLERPSRGASQFVRMSFIEQLRRKKNIAPPGVRNATLPGMAGMPGMPAQASQGASSQMLNLPPATVPHPSAAQLARQLQQSQQMAQQSSRIQQQQMSQQMAMNHVPPGPTAQHQIQAQQQQQAILRARAQQQMLRQGSPNMQSGAQGVQNMPGNARVPSRLGPGGMPEAMGAGTPTQGQVRPMSAMGQPGGQRLVRPVSRMPGNGMGMSNMGQMGQMGSRGSQVPGNQMGQMNNMGMNNMGMNQMGTGNMNNMGQMSTGMNNMGNNMNNMNNNMNMNMNGQMGMNNAGMNNAGMNSAGMNSAGMNSAGMNSAGMNSGMGKAGMNNAGMSNAGMNAGMNTGMNNSMNTGMNTGMSTGMSTGMPMGNQMSNMNMNNMGNGMTNPQMNQMGMGMNRNMPMSPMMNMSPTASPMQDPGRMSSQVPGGPVRNSVSMSQQVPTQIPSQVQNAQGRRLSQPSQTQMRQLMMNRARAAQQAQQRQQPQPPFSPDLM